MPHTRPYFIIPDSTIQDDVIENLFNHFVLQLDPVDGRLTTTKLGTAFAFVFTFVRDSYKSYLHERETEYTSTLHGLENRLLQRETEYTSNLHDLQNGLEHAHVARVGELNGQLQQLALEKQRVDQLLDYKKSTSTRLKSALDEALIEKADAEKLTNTTTALLEQTQLQVVQQSKMIDRLLINSLAQGRTASDDPLTGSVSKSTLWQVQRDIPGNEFAVPLSRLGLAPHSDPAALQAKCRALLSVKYPKEPAMYAPFTVFLQDYLSATGFVVTDTSQFYYLDGLAPDITVSIPGVAVADAMSMVFFVELKAQDGKVLGSDHNLGQVYEYLLAAARCQRERTKFAGILSNFRFNIGIILTRSQTGAYLTHFIGTNMQAILRLVTMIVGDRDYLPPNLGFSVDLGPMFNRLGRPSQSLVAEFEFRESFPASAGAIPILVRDGFIRDDQVPTRMAVKRPKYFTLGDNHREVSTLLMIRALGTHPNLPQIVMISQDHSEVGILPIGAPISAATLSIPGIGATIISNVLDALKFLHDHNVIHRDVRTANVVLHGRTAILIDLDASARRGELTHHLGGCICTPMAVLHSPGEDYVPTPADDFLAVVLMVNSLLFPHAYHGFQSQRLSEYGSDEHVRVLALWAALKASAIWGPLVAAAEAAQVEVLRRGLMALMVTL